MRVDCLLRSSRYDIVAFRLLLALVSSNRRCSKAPTNRTILAYQVVSSSKQPVESGQVGGSSRPAAATGAGLADSARKDRALLSTPAARRDCTLPGETGRPKPQQVSGYPSPEYEL